MKIRQAKPDDAEGIASLLAAYVQETYRHESRVTAEVIRRDCGTAFSAIVAEDNGGTLIGFIVWSPAYDLHCGIKGGDICDLYVIPQKRGQGIALALTANAAKQIQRDGGVYMAGTAASDPPSVKRLYDRIAACKTTTQCTVSAKAFRHLADLADKSAREIVKTLPKKEWNYED